MSYPVNWCFTAVQNMAHLDRMVADSMRDIPSDEDVSDTEDPDLLVCTFIYFYKLLHSL